MSANEHEKSSKDHPVKFQIQIDRIHYTIEQAQMTGAQLRNLPQPPIVPDRDLFEVVPGGSDRKIDDTAIVEMRNGLRFFTAPGTINPGSHEEAFSCVTFE